MAPVADDVGSAAAKGRAKPAPAMASLSFFRRLTGASAWLERRAVLLKAVSFALIGLVNAVVDTSIFFLVHGGLRASGAVVAQASTLADACGCMAAKTPIIVAANLTAWTVAVTGSYVMNSYITFAAESGRRLRWKDYARFVASGGVGLVANTTTLVIADNVMPLWAAKGAAILVGFVVNFGLSHFVVFRPRARGTLPSGKA